MEISQKVWENYKSSSKHEFVVLEETCAVTSLSDQTQFSSGGQ